MAAALTDLFAKASNGTAPVPTTLSAQKLTGAASATITLATGWPTDTAIHFILYQVDANNAMVAGTETLWKGILTGTTINSLTLRSGTDTTYAAGSVVQMAPTSAWADDFVTGMIAEHNQLGIHQKINGNTVPAGTDTVTLNGVSQTLALKTLTAPIITSPTITGNYSGWMTGQATPNTVTYNGNRSYSLVFNATDLTSYISNGMRLKLTRTVTAPTQCTSLNGTTQYYSKSSPAGMTFTTAFTCSAWVKLSSYAAGYIMSRENAAQSTGWGLSVNASGQLIIEGINAGGVFRNGTTYQSLPLNKWVHVAATLDMAGATTTAYIDGVSVSTLLGGAGAPATLTQGTGDFTIGARMTPAAFFPGKIAQVAVYSAVLSAGTIQGSISQTLAGTETSLISAYSFNNSINDLNANANNLTANGSAVATNADSPFAGGATASTAYTAGTTEYGEVFNIVFSTNTTVTVQVPDGYAIPTSGGVSAVSYSTQSSPLGWPGPIVQIGYAQINTIFSTASTTATAVSGLGCTVYVPAGRKVKITFYNYSIQGTASTTEVNLSIWDGTVGSGVQIGGAIVLTATANDNYTSSVIAYSIASGSKTYNVGAFVNSNTGKVQAASTAPAYISVELV